MMLSFGKVNGVGGLGFLAAVTSAQMIIPNSGIAPPLSDLCMSQGEGSCQFAMAIEQASMEPVLQCFAWVFDHACNEIGHSGSACAGALIDSQLPYTIDVLDTEPGKAAAFAYSDGEYGYGYTSPVWGDCSVGLAACTWSRSAFPCPGF